MIRLANFLQTAVNLFPFLLLFVLFTIVGAGCAPRWWNADTLGVGQTPPEVGGGDELIIDLPLPEGASALCVQGAFGEWSHDGPSTLHDIDLDTNNWFDEEVYAPIGGVARVHTESATIGFGYHVNIDLGDGTYVVLGHFKDIFVGDGDEVTRGQLLGYEGCTGSCTGDHIHMGLHDGDAAQKAEFGTSIPVTYLADDLADADPQQGIGSDDFVCGIKSAGDPQDGHTYRSVLPVAMWHPDGTLLKTPDNPMTYQIENGEARWISTESVFWSLNEDFADVVLVSDEEFSCFGQGSNIDEIGLIDAAWEEGTGLLWLRVQTQDDWYRKAVSDAAWEAVLQSWGIDSWSVPLLPSEDPFFATPSRVGFAEFRDGAILKEASRSDVYVISDSWAMPVEDWNTYLLLGFGPRAILTVEDGAVATVQSKVGSCIADVACLDRQAVTQCGGGLDFNDDSSTGGQGGGEHDQDEQTQTTYADTDSDSDTDSDTDTDTGAPAQGTLNVSWTTPFAWTAQDITLSGEYIFQDGTYGFTWRELLDVGNVDRIDYALPGVGSGDTFRFSVEYTDSGGVVSWSCIGPYPPGTLQGSAAADVDGTPVTITEAGDPTGLTNGCGLFLTVP